MYLVGLSFSNTPPTGEEGGTCVLSFANSDVVKSRKVWGKDIKRLHRSFRYRGPGRERKDIKTQHFHFNASKRPGENHSVNGPYFRKARIQHGGHQTDRDQFALDPWA